MKLALAALLICITLTANAHSATLPKAFSDARIAPADVTLYVHVEDAAELRRELADRPIAQWLHGLVREGEIRMAWTKLAQTCQMNEGEVLDACLGRGAATLMSRGEGHWTVLSEVDEEQISKLLQQLRVRVREPRAGMAVCELPEQEVLLAHNAQALVIGPAKHPKLFFEVLKRLEEPSEPSLLSESILPQLASLRDGNIGVFIRHEPPMGGHSMLTAKLQGDRLTINHASTFDHAPFSRGVTSLTSDFSPVLKFENHALITMMQPADVGDGPVEAFLAANLGETLVSRDMRKNLGDRRMLVVGEVEGRQLKHPVDLLSTSFATCVEVKDGEMAAEQLDEQMLKITARLNALGKGTFLIDLPHIAALRACDARSIDVSPATDWFTGGFPIMQNISLNWRVVEGPQGTWCVIASHPESLNEVTGVLKSSSPSHARSLGRFDSCGTSNGIRIARHLRSWSDEAAKFAEPADVEEFRSTLHLMSDFAAGVQHCRWQLARPTANQMRLDVQIELAPPQSTRQE